MKQTKKIAQKKVEKKTKIKDVTVNENDEVVRLIKIVIALVVIVLIFFGITYLVTKKSDTKEKEETEIQYTEILVGEIWNKGGTYYVLVGYEEDSYMSMYETYLNLYKNYKDSDSKYYLINLDNVFNRNYVAETSNLYTTNPSEVRFKDTTLLKVVDGTVTETYEGKDAITSYLEGILQQKCSFLMSSFTKNTWTFFLKI